MEPRSYLDVNQRFAAEIDAETEKALEALGPAADELREAVAGLLRHQKFVYPLSVLPLLVHGAETGAPEPALPLAAVHTLWWTSACYFDDVADGNTSIVARGAMSAEGALLASVVTGHVLPIRVLRSLRVPERIRGALTDEALACSVAAAEGQLADMRGDVTGATRKSVLETYRGKSGAPFGMITAMAALLAGADADKAGLWREFGHVFGVLWQLFNDQEDMLSGRGEDLANGTVTYLLACALDVSGEPRAAAPLAEREQAPETEHAPDRQHASDRKGVPGRELVPGGERASVERLVELHTAAKEPGPARAELTGILLSPAVLERYGQDLIDFRDQASRLLDGLGNGREGADGRTGDADGSQAFLPVLRQLVDQSSRLLLRPEEPVRPAVTHFRA